MHTNLCQEMDTIFTWLSAAVSTAKKTDVASKDEVYIHNFEIHCGTG